MSYGLETIQYGGRIRKAPTATFDRAIVVEDLEMLQMDRAPKLEKQRTPLRMLSERHRNLARLLGSGMTNDEAAVVTGYTPSTLSHLRTDPAMINLIKHYGQERDLAQIESNEKMAQLTSTILDHLQDRFEDPDAVAKMTEGQLLHALEVVADRSGLGPSSKSEVQVNVNIASRLEAARKRVQAHMIDVKAVEVK